MDPLAIIGPSSSRPAYREEQAKQNSSASFSTTPSSSFPDNTTSALPSTFYYILNDGFPKEGTEKEDK